MNLKKAGAIIIPTLISIAILAYMLLRVWDDLIIAVQNAVPAYLTAAVAICVCAWFVRGARYRYILSQLETDFSFLKSTACIYVTQTANLIIPARLGDFLRIFILKHEKQTPYSNGLSSIVVERFFDIAIVALLGALAMPFVLNVPEWFSTVIGVTLGLCIVFVIILFLAGNFKSENKFIKIGLNLIDQIKNTSIKPASLLIIGVTSALIWLCDSLICYVIALMFNVEIPFIIVILAIVIGNLIKAVPVTPGGIGTYELAVAVTLEISGTPAAAATLIAVIDHLVKNVITLIGGIISMYVFGDWAVDMMKTAFSRGINKKEIESQ